MQEGVIKFNCEWIKEESLDYELIKELNNGGINYMHCIIAVTGDGVGYVNISIRYKQNNFISINEPLKHIP